MAEPEAGNGPLEVVLEPDRMSAWLSVRPAGGGRCAVEDVRRALTDAGVRYGVDHPLLARLPLDVPGDHLVARGRPPVTGSDGHVVVVVRPDVVGPDGPVIAAEGDDVDFRAFSRLSIVTAGQVVATVVPPTPGVAGCDVTGKPVPAAPGRRPRLKAGANVEEAADGLVLRAAVDGLLVADATTVAVRPALVIDGSVDFETGSVAFPGDVVVRGSVLPGFRVTGRRVLILHDIEQAEVVGQEEVWVRGVVAGERSLVRCGGDIGVRVVYEGRLEAGRDVFVDREVHEGVVLAGRSVVLEAPRTRIAGGVVVAGQEVTASEIGSLAGIPTFVRVGHDPFDPDAGAASGADPHPEARVAARLAFRPGTMVDIGTARLAVVKDEIRREATWADGRIALGAIGGPARHRPQERRWGQVAREVERGGGSLLPSAVGPTPTPPA